MKRFFSFLLFGCFSFCGFAANTDVLCPHPDVPSNGKYTPHQRKFEPGDEISYTCQKGFALSGKERRICKLNGIWSDRTPFCDPSVPLSNPTVTNVIASSSLLSVIDGNFRSCFDWYNATGEHMYLHFNKTIVVHLVKIFFKKGITKIEISTGFNNDMRICADFDNFIETDRWIEMECKSSVLADMLKILAIQTHNRLASICEVAVYGKEKDSCKHSPIRTVRYGHFEVSRTKATLVCEEGYKSKNSRLVCEGSGTWTGGGFRCEEILCQPNPSPGLSSGEWLFLESTRKLSAGTTSQLKCNSGYHKIGTPDNIICLKNGTWSKTNATCVEDDKSTSRTRWIIFGSVVAFVILLITALLATIICVIRKHKGKEVVVVYQSQSEGRVPLSNPEIECAINLYEDLKPRPPDRPPSPRPMAKLSTMSRVAVNESDSWKNSPNQETLPSDVDFDTMKMSTVYGS